LLAERSFGDLRGTPYDQIPGDPFAADFAPPNGESWDVFHARVDAAFAWVLGEARRADGNLVVVTHGLVCRAFAQKHLTLAHDHELPGRFSNTSVTIFDLNAPHVVRLLDCTVHLREGQQSGANGGAA
jgi:broad specificity phosphatase PhoE